VSRPNGQIDVFDRPLSDGFVRPCSVADVVEVLEAVPTQFTRELRAVYLLGGTEHQLRVNDGVFGMYRGGHEQIYLFAYPSAKMTFTFKRALKPSASLEYAKFGAQVVPAPRGGSTVKFDEASLRLFYLYDVLLHEIGHHVDRGNLARDREAFAHWFAQFQHARLRERPVSS